MKKISLVLLLLLCSATGIVMAISGSSQKEKENATPIEVGLMSGKQKEHSKLYEQYRTGRKLDAIPPSEFAKVAEPGVYLEPGTPVINPEAPPISFEEFTKNLACEADAIVTATIKDQSSQLTENKEFIFTDYSAVVEEVHKNNQSASISPNSIITITRPGGRVEIKGKVVAALDAAFKLLKEGHRYLLFLKYVPQTGAYQSIRQGGFLIKGNSLVAMTDEAVAGGTGDTRKFTYSVRSALYSNCVKQ
jgi:hypothetical protein